MSVNFGLTASDYARHRAGFPKEFFERVFSEEIIKSNDRLIDLGTGTGTLACGFAQRGCIVTGVDISAQMLEQARNLSGQAGLKIDFLLAKAEASGLSDSSFDVASAGQCWHWFERANAAAEIMRILKPNGRTVIAHFDSLPVKGNVVDLTEKLIQTYNPKWYLQAGGRTGIYAEWPRDLGEAGFLDIQTFSFDLDVPYTQEAWRGRIRASSGVGASLSAEDVGKFDSELKSLLEARSQPILQIPQRLFVLHARKAG